MDKEMDKKMDKDQAIMIIRSCVADSLALELDEVSFTSRLIPDLGADSLDFVDIIFMLEKKFGVKIQEGELDFLARVDISSPDVMRDGFLTRESVEKLRPWLPALNEAPDPGRVSPHELFSMITVETLWIMVEHKLAEKGGSGGSA